MVYKSAFDYTWAAAASFRLYNFFFDMFDACCSVMVWPALSSNESDIVVVVVNW